MCDNKDIPANLYALIDKPIFTYGCNVRITNGDITQHFNLIEVTTEQEAIAFCDFQNEENVLGDIVYFYYEVLE